jgi:hypothetical protein
MSLRDKILAIQNDTPSEIVEIPEWGGIKVLVKGFTLGAKDDFLASILDKQTNEPNVKAFNVGILVGTAHDPESGEKLFSEEDVPILKQKSAAAIDRLIQVGQRLSGLTEEAVDVAAKKSSSTTKDEQNS